MEKEGLFARIVVVVLAVAVLATLVDAAASRRRPQPEPRVLTVMADAYEEAEPDVAKVSLGVKAVRQTPGQAATQVSQVVDAIKAALTKLGVAPDAVETSELYLGEESEYNYRLGRTVRQGYKAYHWLRVTLKHDDFGKLASVVDRGVAAGATSMSGLAFEVEDDNALRAKALAKATARARDKAMAMAEAAGTHVVGVQRISDHYYEYRGYPAGKAGYPVEAEQAMAPEAAAPEGLGPAEAPSGASASGEPSAAPAAEAEAALPGKLRIMCTVEAAFLVR